MAQKDYFFRIKNRMITCTGKKLGPYLPLLLHMHDIWSVTSRENYNNWCHQISILWLKCTKFDFGWGSAPDPAGGAYSTSQAP